MIIYFIFPKCHFNATFLFNANFFFQNANALFKMSHLSNLALKKCHLALLLLTGKECLLHRIRILDRRAFYLNLPPWRVASKRLPIKASPSTLK